MVKVLLKLFDLVKVEILLSKFFFGLANQKYYILDWLGFLQTLVKQT